MNILEAKNLTFSYRNSGIESLKLLNLEIKKGEFVFITGKSGCGKSSFLNLISGVTELGVAGDFTGELIIDENELISLVVQNIDAQFFNLTVREELMFGPENLGIAEEIIEERVKFVSEFLDINHLLDREPTSLSMGEKQICAIASVLTMKPSILCLDEPTANLDYRSTIRLYRLLTRLNKEEGLTIILADHRNDGLAEHIHRVVILENGNKIIDSDNKILKERAKLKKLGIRASKDINADILKEKINEEEDGKEILLDVIDLNYSKNKKKLLSDINFKIKKGEIISFLGEMGAGKSTLANILSGLVKADSGTIKICGEKPAIALKKGLMSLILQNPKHQLFCDTVDEEISFAPHNFDKYDEEYINELISILELENYRKSSVHSLSGGQSQRLAIGSAISISPELIILDEPTSGQDWQNLEKLMGILEKLKVLGKSSIIITHDWRLANYFTERFVFLQQGKTVSRETYVESMMNY